MAATSTTKTTKPAPKTAPVEYDFDNWDADAEEKAITLATPDVRYIIVETRFIGRFLDGTLLELPLRLSIDDVDELDALEGGPVDQVKHLLTKLGGAKAAKDFTAHNISESMLLAAKYFTILQRISGASLPE